MEDLIAAYDVNIGDVIVLPGGDEEVLVRMVRFGQGRLIFTVTSAGTDSPEEEQAMKVTTEVRLHGRGQDMVQ